ncbi:MAG: type II secretion system F family protein [Planctomycetia bacterium]|nr:type II secretion system F family protein [Planctomycetia bacterium]
MSRQPSLQAFPESDRRAEPGGLQSLFSPRIGTADLARFCRRVGTSLAAGIDIRKVFDREAHGHGSFTLRSQMRRSSDQVARGETLGAALAATGSYFPPLVRELAAVGEHTGKTAEVFVNLADHYDHQLSMRRAFFLATLWPRIEFFAAVFIVGLLIWVQGLLPMREGKPIDVLGWGLVGNQGLLIYLLIFALLTAGYWALKFAMRRGMLWTRPLQKLLLRIPGVGRFLELLALSRLAWTMHLTFNTSLPLKQAIPLCLQSTQNARYTDQSDAIVSAATSGRELDDAFASTRVFPTDFLDTLEVGVRTGQLPETMGHLADQYRGEAQRRMAIMGMIGGFGVLLLVMGLIVATIFSILAQTLFPYYQLLNDLSDPNNLGR